MSASAYRPDIDGLRSIAVLSVLLFHLDIVVFSGGFIGVDVFFVISGFLITRIIVNELEKTGKFSFSRFYVRRIRRLFPAFLTVALGTTIACLLLFSPSDLERYGAVLFHSVFSVSNIYFWSESGYFTAGSELNPLLHTWSLSVEEQFYMFWPALAAFLFSRGGSRKVFRVIVVLVILSLLLNLFFDQKIIQAIWPDTSNDSLDKIRAAMFYLTPFRIFELGIGALLVFLMSKRSENNSVNEGLFIVGLIMILIPIFIYTEETVFPSYNALLPCIGTALIIFANNPKVSGSLLRNAVAVKIGLLSYSLYLVHWPIIVLYKYWKLGELNAIDQISIAAASILLSWLIYKFIEQPFRRPVKSELGGLPNGRFITLLGVLSAGFVIAGANMWGMQGWTWRLDAERQEIVASISNPKELHRLYYGGSICKPKDYCVVNKGKGSNVYFIGDSHSQQYAYGLAKSFSKYQFTHINNRCRFNTLDYCFAGRFQGSSFFKNKQESLKELKDSGDKIIIGQAWGKRRTYFDEISKTKIRFPDNETYVNFLVSELVKFDEYMGGNRVVVIGQVNRFGNLSDPLNCLSRPFGALKCDYSAPTYAVELNQLLGLGLKEAGIPFISPTKIMCRDKVGCMNFSEDRMPLYSDAGHLSTWGSRYVVQQSKKELARALRPSKRSKK